MSCTSTESSSELEHRCWSERTLALIKPEAFEDAEAILDHIKANKFTVLAKRILQLSPEHAAELYRFHYGELYFPHLVAQMASGPMMALVLGARNCIEKWLELLGPANVAEAQAYWPESLRACYGRRSKFGDFFNGLHGSKDLTEAYREIHFFFPQMIVGPILRKWQVNDYILKHLKVVLHPGLAILAKEQPAEPILWLAKYLKDHNPNEPEVMTVEREEAMDERCHTPRPSLDSMINQI